MIASKQTCTKCRLEQLTMRPMVSFVCNDCKKKLQGKTWSKLQAINNGNVVERGL